MKSLVAILFSLALVWAQSAPAGCGQTATTATGRTVCKCCQCGGADCCMKNTAPRSEPAPAAPAPQVTQQGQILLLAPAAVAFVLPRPASSTLSTPAAAPARAAALPLYQQNCTFLL